MIEMPVLFSHYDNSTLAAAYTNNVVNSIVDGSALFVADVHGPALSGADLFDSYVDEAAQLVGFVGATKCEERVYHAGTGSIHCGTNVLRDVPAEKWWNQLS
jgi:protein-arginine deiminase